MRSIQIQRMLNIGFALLMCLALLVPAASPAQASILPAASQVTLPNCPTNLLISEYIEGSSNNKAIEIYNGTGATINLAAWEYNLKYYFNGSSSPGLTINLTGTVTSGDVYVVAHGSANATILAQADQRNSSGWFNGDDAIALYRGATLVDVIGVIGTDPGSEWGSALTSTADNTLTRLSTINVGDTNPSDAFNPSAQWTGYANDTFSNLGSHSLPCTMVYTGDLAITKTGPGAVVAGDNLQYRIKVQTPGTATAYGVVVTDTLPVGVTYVSDSNSGAHTALGGQMHRWDLGDLGAYTSFVVTVTVSSDPGLAAGLVLTNTAQTSGSITGDSASNNLSKWPISVQRLTPIYQIQGASHTSPYSGTLVLTQGVVTAVRTNGFYIQTPDAQTDGDPNTSEGLWIYTSIAPTVGVGDTARVAGTVREYFGATSSLPVTQIENPGRTVTKMSSNNPLPVPVVVGNGGRVPPNMVIENDVDGDDVLTDPDVFDPAQDGLDFYESLEGMAIRVNNPLIVGPKTSFNEIGIVPDGGAGAGLLTGRKSLIIRANDYNPERILLDDTIVANPPDVVPGMSFTAPITGVLDYSFGNFKLFNTRALPTATGSLAKETTGLTRSANQLTVATFNMENLSPADVAQIADLAEQIVTNLDSPDIIAVQEIQDNNGETDTGVVDASQTFNALITAITTAGGPTYQFRQINPQDNTDGGAPGGNIRVGFLFRTDRGLSFIDRGAGNATSATAAYLGQTGLELSLSPGRVDPTNVAFDDSRKPLAGEFLFNSHKLIVVANHLNSKSGDHPLFGRYQPPVLASEAQRMLQAEVLNNFVDSLLAIDPNALVVVLGDMNDFPFSNPLQRLQGSYPGDTKVLTNLHDLLPENERYTYNYDANAQALDNILVSKGIMSKGVAVDVVHFNSEFMTTDRTSDHDPVLARLNIAPREVRFSASNFLTSGFAAHTYQVRVELSFASVVPVTVTYATSDGSALDGEDYLATSGQVVFAPGQTARSFPVQILAALGSESQENIILTLTSPLNALLGLPNPAQLIIPANFLNFLPVMHMPPKP